MLKVRDRGILIQMDEVKIVYGQLDLIPSFYKTLDLVARERDKIELIEAPPYEKVFEFQRSIIESKHPVYYALFGDQVIGWCDLRGGDNPRLKHRCSGGMGLLKEFRGRGIGTQLLSAGIKHAKELGYEKVELQVYSTNTNAIRLYKKLGFEQEGLIKNYRKLDGKYFDAFLLGKFL